MTKIKNRAQLALDLAGITCVHAPAILLGTAGAMFTATTSLVAGAFVVAKSNETVQITPMLRAKAAIGSIGCGVAMMKCMEIASESIINEIDEFSDAIGRYRERAATIKEEE